MALSLASLMVRETKAAIYATAIKIASNIGVPVTSWQPGDPTRSLFYLEAELLEALEGVVANFIASGFLDYATGIWLKILAKQVFNVDVPAATAATTDLVLTNAGGGRHELAAGDLTVKSSTSGKTFRNITGGTLLPGPGTTLTVTVVADELGSESSAGATEIDELVTGLLGVTCSNPTAAVGIDEQEESVTRQQCRDKTDALSPNGPARAYAFVARNAALTGTNGVTRVRVYDSSETGDVTVYLAGPSGGVSEPDRVLVEAAIAKWCTPLCITPSIFAASNVTVAVTYALWVYKSVNLTAAQVAAGVEKALAAMLLDREIGGDIIDGGSGKLYASLIGSTIRAAYPQIFRVVVSVPGDTAIGSGQVAVLGTVTPSVNIVVDP